jgi:hypothetical protein
MTIPLPPIVAAYVGSINDHDPAAFDTLFARDAVVRDIGRAFCGSTVVQVPKPMRTRPAAR